MIISATHPFSDTGVLRSIPGSEKNHPASIKIRSKVLSTHTELPSYTPEMTAEKRKIQQDTKEPAYCGYTGLGMEGSDDKSDGFVRFGKQPASESPAAGLKDSDMIVSSSGFSQNQKEEKPVDVPANRDPDPGAWRRMGMLTLRRYGRGYHMPNGMTLPNHPFIRQLVQQVINAIEAQQQNNQPPREDDSSTESSDAENDNMQQVPDDEALLCTTACNRIARCASWPFLVLVSIGIGVAVACGITTINSAHYTCRLVTCAVARFRYCCPLAYILAAPVFICAFVVLLPVYTVFFISYMIYFFTIAVIEGFNPPPIYEGFLQQYPEPMAFYQHVYNWMITIHL